MPAEFVVVAVVGNIDDQRLAIVQVDAAVLTADAVDDRRGGIDVQRRVIQEANRAQARGVVIVERQRGAGEVDVPGESVVAVEANVRVVGWVHQVEGAGTADGASQIETVAAREEKRAGRDAGGKDDVVGQGDAVGRGLQSRDDTLGDGEGAAAERSVVAHLQRAQIGRTGSAHHQCQVPDAAKERFDEILS